MIVAKVPVTFCLTINWNGPDDKVPAMMQAYIAGAADVLADRASRGVAHSWSALAPPSSACAGGLLMRMPRMHS